MRKIFILMIFYFAGLAALRAQENLGPINWISFEEAERLDSTEHRPFMIDVYTDWCGWCKRMMATTFQNQQLASYINQNFYCVRFDAETSDTIKFMGKEWTSDGRTNALASHLLGNRLSYPTIVYIDREKRIAPIPGFMEAKTIEPILVFFSENLSTLVGLDEFRYLYMASFPKSFENELKTRKLEIDTTGSVNWLSVNEAMELFKKEKKPIVIDVYVDEKYRGQVPYITMGSIVHEKAVFKDKKLADYINGNYYPIRIEATTTDTIHWMDIKDPFTSLGKGMPNKFVASIMNDQYVFPAVFFFDEQGNYISKVNSFFSSSIWEVIMKFYAHGAYKTESFEKFYSKNINN